MSIQDLGSSSKGPVPTNSINPTVEVLDRATGSSQENRAASGAANAQLAADQARANTRSTSMPTTPGRPWP